MAISETKVVLTVGQTLLIILTNSHRGDEIFYICSLWAGDTTAVNQIELKHCRIESNLVSSESFSSSIWWIEPKL